MAANSRRDRLSNLFQQPRFLATQEEALLNNNVRALRAIAPKNTNIGKQIHSIAPKSIIVPQILLNATVRNKNTFERKVSIDFSLFNVPVVNKTKAEAEEYVTENSNVVCFRRKDSDSDSDEKDTVCMVTFMQNNTLHNLPIRIFTTMMRQVSLGIPHSYLSGRSGILNIHSFFPNIRYVYSPGGNISIHTLSEHKINRDLTKQTFNAIYALTPIDESGINYEDSIPIENRSYYHGTLSTQDADDLLHDKPDGTFFIRYSSNIKKNVLMIKRENTIIKMSFEWYPEYYNCYLYPGLNGDINGSKIAFTLHQLFLDRHVVNPTPLVPELQVPPASVLLTDMPISSLGNIIYTGNNGQIKLVNPSTSNVTSITLYFPYDDARNFITWNGIGMFKFRLKIVDQETTTIRDIINRFDLSPEKKQQYIDFINRIITEHIVAVPPPGSAAMPGGRYYKKSKQSKRSKRSKRSTKKHRK